MDKDKNTYIYKLITIISGVFTLLIALLLLINYFQLNNNNPINSETLELLIERLKAEPDNEQLIQEVRNFDLLSRKAFFNSIWQIQTLSFILILGAITFIASLRIYTKQLHVISLSKDESNTNSKQRSLAQMWLLSVAIVIVLFSIFSAYFSADYYKIYQPSNAIQDTEGDEIERITLSSQESFEIVEVETDSIESIEADSIVPEINITPFTEANVRLNHNTFRGAWGHGISYRRNLPTTWNVNTGENIIWKTKIPEHGYNSPVIWQDKLFLSGASGTKRVIYCIDINTGKILWEREANNISGSPATPPKTTEDTGLAAATLAVDNERVYAIFGTGDIIAFDFEGNRVWARNLGVPSNHYGHSSSLIVWAGKVFVQYDTQAGSKVMALSTTTGNILWQTARSDDVSWSSPIIAKVDGKFQLILLSLPGFSGYDINTGQQLWYVECMSGEVGTSPAFGDGLVYAGNEYAKLVAVDPKTGEIVWEDNYYLPEVSSPVYHDGLLYIATSYAVVACFDAKTGEFIWEYDANRGFYSSPIIADGKLYVFDLDGKAYILRPGREPRLISSPVMGESVYATPVFTDGRMYIRGNNHLYCIGSK
jgi:outer membrane protein assembly factor BamB